MNRYVITISAIAGLIIIIGALARDMHTERRDKQRAILERITLSAQQATEAFAVATQNIQPGDSAKRLLAFRPDTAFQLGQLSRKYAGLLRDHMWAAG